MEMKTFEDIVISSPENEPDFEFGRVMFENGYGVQVSRSESLQYIRNVFNTIVIWVNHHGEISFAPYLPMNCGVARMREGVKPDQITKWMQQVQNLPRNKWLDR